MPLKEKFQQGNLSESMPTKEPTFEELEKMKKELFEAIQSHSGKLNETDKMYIVSYVGNFSVKDAFEISKRLGLSGNRTFFAVTNEDVVQKNQKFFAEFEHFLKTNEEYAQDDFMVLNDGVRRIHRGLDSKSDDVRLERENTRRGAGDLGVHIASYYENFIRNRRVKSPEQPRDGRTQVEIAAEEHLRSAEALLNESYYTGPIREVIGMKAGMTLGDFNAGRSNFFPYDTGGDNLLLTESEYWALQADMVDMDTLKGIYVKFFPDETKQVFSSEDPIERAVKDVHGEGATIPKELRIIREKTQEETFAEEKIKNKIRKKFRSAKYEPSTVVFETRRKEAVKALLFGTEQSGLKDGDKKPYKEKVDGIKQSLIKRGFKEGDFEIVLNEESGEWEVREKSKIKIQNSNIENEGIETERNNDFRKVGEVNKFIDLYPGDSFDLAIIEKRKEETYEDETLYKKNYAQPIIINGEIYVNAEAYRGYNYLTYPDGRKTVPLCAMQDIKPLKSGGLVFVFNDNKDIGRNNFQISKGGQRINFDNNWQTTGSYIEGSDGSVYWIGVHAPTDRSYQLGGEEEALFKDGEKIKDLGDGDYKVEEYIGGKPVLVSRGMRASSVLIWGDQEFGPYNEIKLCENSKDKLVFCYKLHDRDRYVLHVEGKGEVVLDTKDFVDDISGKSPESNEIIEVVKAGEDYFIRFKTDDKGEFIAKANFKESGTASYGFFWHSNKGTFKDLQETSSGQITFIQKYENEYGVLIGKRKMVILPLNDMSNLIYHNDLLFTNVDNRLIIVPFNSDPTDSRSGRLLSSNDKTISFEGTIELVKSADKLFIIEKLADKTRVWEYDERGELKLNDKEQRDLDLANAVQTEDLDTIWEYFNKYYLLRTHNEWINPIQSGIKKAVQQSKSFVRAVNETIKEAPQMFLDTFRAKDDKPTEFLMTEMFYYMFPEAKEKRERALREKKRNAWSPFNIFGGGGEGGRGRGEGSVDYDAGFNKLASVDEAGYYEMMKENREVLRMREALSVGTFISRGIFGAYNGKGWSKVNIPLNEVVSDPAKETTFELVDPKMSKQINLPKIAGSKILEDRIKGVTKDKKEIPVKVLEHNPLGEVRIDKGNEAKEVTYSMSYSEMPITMAEIGVTDYEKFKKQFEKSFGNSMSAPIGDVGDELNIFVRGLEGKSPKEKVVAIQDFCYEYGYYNVDSAPRDTDSLEERLSIMEYRMNEIKDNNKNLSGKKFAGICTDFATLTTALLRKAGFVSGIASGFVVDQGALSVRTSTAHAVSYVLWPNPGNKDGKPDFIIVDGTPSGLTPTLKEQEKIANAVSKELVIDSEKKMLELERMLRTMDVEAIKKLENGQLERTLNLILYGVKQSHIEVMARVLNASRYAGFDIVEMERGNIEEEIEFRKFLEEEVLKERGVKHENRERRGEDLLNMMLEFADRFKKDKNVKNREEVFDILQKVFDVAKSKLDPIESRSATAVITYLRAKKMM